MNTFNFTDKFENRHIGPNAEDTKSMLTIIGVDSIDELIDKTVPSQIRMKKELDIESPLTESQYLDFVRLQASQNKIAKSYIGMGYYPTITPPVIQRTIMENPGWYTQYTPYQAEISQGRLEALINFQTMIIELTGLSIANASLLDEATAAAEAMILLYSYSKSLKRNKNKFFVNSEVYPQTLSVLITRSVPLGIEVVTGNYNEFEFTDDFFGLLVQYPAGKGNINNFTDFFIQAKEKEIYTVVAADLLSLTLLTPPGEFGADIAIGSTQRFGVPMGYGGPHAAYFACRDEFKRIIPGRIIGASIDSNDNLAYRMALQTREQHIRREKATSNICTAQVLLAVMAGMYSVYHGPDGLKNIAVRLHKLTVLLDEILKKYNYKQVNDNFFDTLQVLIEDSKLYNLIKDETESKNINLRYIDEKTFGISLNETVSFDDIFELASIFASAKKENLNRKEFEEIANTISEKIPVELVRKTQFLQHPIFNKYHSETALLRYTKRLENKDLSLTGSMIPLGSCTMKLNAAAEMMGISLPRFGNIHPFAPKSQVPGYTTIISELEKYLAEITGLTGVSLQPNSGAQGEYAGLMVIRQYHIFRGDAHRDVVLIPSSAHGTNPASAVMAGMKVIVVNCDDHGNIDVDDLVKKAELYKENLSALMVTYPSTHGVFEESIQDICSIIHKNGGQVYMDGANMNAQVGLTSPALIGADVCHLNLHKTFAIPHGGGGPGVGPICVAEHLKQFLPGHSVVNIGNENSIGAVSASQYGSASILLISLGYIKMLGAKGLTNSTKYAILNANYIKSRLDGYYKTLFSGKNGFIAHEMIFDMREFKRTANIEVEDIAKRLIDYGFHAPTVSFPVPGTLMVEPTESEPKAELDRFCDAMIQIRKEIEEIEKGEADKTDNVLKNSPHTMDMVMAEEWKHSYSREKAAFPTSFTKAHKFWPSVARINSAYGDRNLVCACVPISEYTDEIVN
jgi:glycine dehydrogenase